MSCPFGWDHRWDDFCSGTVLSATATSKRLLFPGVEARGGLGLWSQFWASTVLPSSGKCTSASCGDHSLPTPSTWLGWSWPDFLLHAHLAWALISAGQPEPQRLVYGGYPTQFGPVRFRPGVVLEFWEVEGLLFLVGIAERESL